MSESRLSVPRIYYAPFISTNRPIIEHHFPVFSRFCLWQNINQCLIKHTNHPGTADFNTFLRILRSTVHADNLTCIASRRMVLGSMPIPYPSNLCSCFPTVLPNCAHLNHSRGESHASPTFRLTSCLSRPLIVRLTNLVTQPSSYQRFAHRAHTWWLISVAPRMTFPWGPSGLN